MTRPVSLYVALFLTIGPTLVSEAYELEVHLDDCPLVDRESVLRILDLELSQVQADQPVSEPLVADIACNESDAEVRAWDPVTQRHLKREVTIDDAAERDVDRLFAIIVAQLYIASWAETWTRRWCMNRKRCRRLRWRARQ